MGSRRCRREAWRLDVGTGCVHTGVLNSWIPEYRRWFKSECCLQIPEPGNDDTALGYLTNSTWSNAYLKHTLRGKWHLINYPPCSKFSLFQRSHTVNGSPNNHAVIQKKSPQVSTLFTRCDHEPIWLRQALARPRPHCPLGLPAPGAMTTLSVLVSITGLVTLHLYHNCLIKVSDTHWEKSKLLTEGEKSSPRREVSGRTRKGRQK